MFATQSFTCGRGRLLHSANNDNNIWLGSVSGNSESSGKLAIFMLGLGVLQQVLGFRKFRAGFRV
jgi:hypothetical protein